MSDRDILWKQYAQNIDLYKFYMELVIKLNVFYYAVTGAILSYFFAHSEVENIRFALLLPLVMSAAFAGFFVYGAHLMESMRQEVFAIRDALGLKVAPELQVLVVLLYIFTVVFCFVAIGCGYLLWCN